MRDFRGAMTGRGDKGSAPHHRHLHRRGQGRSHPLGSGPPIDLIDGYQLCDLLKKYDLGVHATTRVVEDIEVDEGFFADV